MKEIRFEGDTLARLRRERDEAYAEVMQARATVGLDPFSTHGELIEKLEELVAAWFTKWAPGDSS